ncbi:MAG: protease [Bdellovibrio sp.]|jgi:hypothetical protein
MGKFFTLFLATFFAFSFSHSALAAPSVFKNISSIRQTYRIDKALAAIPKGQKIKIAILDKAWTGLQAEIGKTLPPTTRFIDGAVPVPTNLTSNHGLRMAQIVSEMLGAVGHKDQVDLRLYQVYGFSNFKQAINALIQDPPHVVLYSEVWEFGGNFDGRGFINQEVNRATNAGIVWVNASGNFGFRTWNSSIKTINEDWVKLPDQNNAWKIICEAPKGKKCPVKVVLSWNDFKDDSEVGTNRDLDLALTDDFLNIIQTSTLKQSDDRNESRPGYSKYPREVVATEVKPGSYFVRVKNASKNFTGNSEMLRLTADGDFLKVDSVDFKESLLNPGDNPNVISVGAIDSERTSRSVRLGRPDLWAVSSIQLDKDNEFRGTSNSAAITAASVALTVAYNSSRGYTLNRQQVLDLLSLPFNWDRGNVSQSTLGFGPASGRCYEQGQWPRAPEAATRLLALGAAIVSTTDGWKVMTAFDPWLIAGLKKVNDDDRLLVRENGYFAANRFDPINPGAVEVFQRPTETGLCRRPLFQRGNLLRPF